MEDKFQLQENGQSVIKADLDLLGETAGLADDRVFAELFRMAPYDGSTVARGITTNVSTSSGATMLVAPNGASGSVLVQPFRAFIGSRTAVGAGAKANWRDVRSAIGVGSTTLAQSVSLAANSSGNPRWDLVYAAIAVDADAATVARKVKDTTTKVIGEQNVVTAKRTVVTLGVVAGTAGATPAWPAAPSDAGGTYYIPLAYVRIPNGFGASSTVLVPGIAIIAPCVSLSAATGGVSMGPTDQRSYLAGKAGAWGSSGTPPGTYLPSTGVGGHTLLVPIGLRTGNLTHTNGAVLDARDWRKRVVRWTAVVSNDGVGAFPWEQNTEELFIPSASIVHGAGQTFWYFSDSKVATVNSTLAPEMAATAVVDLFVDVTTGALKLSITNAPNCHIFFWLEFSAPMNRA